MSAPDLLARLERDTLVAIGAMAAVAFLVRPDAPRIALGVVGGGVLVGLSYWAIRGAVDVLMDRAIQGQNRRHSSSLALVKFFTRHAILAVAGYIMMTRLTLHPVGMLLGVTAPALAVAFEAAAGRRVRRP